MIRPKMKLYNGAHLMYAHVKYDGHYLEVHKNEQGVVTCTSRQGTELDLKWVPTLANAWVRLPPGTTLLGELWYPNKPASYIKTAIKNQDRQLTFSVFAATGLADDTLETLCAECLRWGFVPIPFYSRVPRGSSFCLGSFDNDNMPPMQHEGFVMKAGVWTDWRKYKPFRSIDLIVHDVNDGRGKYVGQVGSLTCKTTEGHVVANVSGFTDDERILLSASDIGKVCEVKYQYVGAQGRLRHPNFIQWRDDKLPEECTVDQDPELSVFYAGMNDVQT
jgi:ATP-dependent DNA ligase